MIHSGGLEPGERLPPERELLHQLGVSQPVVRKAGLLSAHVGRGRFAVGRPSRQAGTL